MSPSLPFPAWSLPVKKDPGNCAEVPGPSVTLKPHGFWVQLIWSNEEASGERKEQGMEKHLPAEG